MNFSPFLVFVFVFLLEISDREADILVLHRRLWDLYFAIVFESGKRMAGMWIALGEHLDSTWRCRGDGA